MKQRSKYGQRGPIRASGGVGTSVHSLDDQGPGVAEGGRDGGGHRALLGAILGVRDRLFEAATRCEQIDHRDAFSTWPLVPSRRASSASTRAIGIRRAVSPTMTWKIKS